MPDKAQQISENGATRESKQQEQEPKIPRNPKEAERKAPRALDKSSSNRMHASTEDRQVFYDQWVENSKQHNGNKFIGGFVSVNQKYVGQTAFNQGDQHNGNTYDFTAK